MARPTEARIDTDALRHNAQIARALAPSSKLMAVVKADAYGHGAINVARALVGAVDALAVASLEEAVALRDAEIKAPILLLQGVFEARELGVAAGLGLWVTLQNETQLRWLEETKLPAQLRCWLKVDTGMNRLGVSPDEAAAFLQRIADSGKCHEGVVLSTHFAAADNLADAATAKQIQCFSTLSLPGERSASNSAALLAWPEAHYDWVRPGYMLYGHSPLVAPHSSAENLQPVMTLASKIIALRDVAAGESVGYGGTWVAGQASRIATVAIGYGDGYPRQARNGTPVLVRGRRALLAGRVSMDMITVDVTDIPDASLADEVILWGADLPLAEIATNAGTIGYELTTRMPARVTRVLTRK
ncbi:MAG: alanine racemase [Bacteroidia bacterium]|jgi:alanine racemase